MMLRSPSRNIKLQVYTIMITEYRIELTSLEGSTLKAFVLGVINTLLNIK